MTGSLIRYITPNDAAAVAEIYNYYILSTVITFEEEPVSAVEMGSRICSVTAAYPWFVLEEAGEVCGYAYANQFRDRSAWRFAAEISIYLKNGMEGQGRGSALMARLLDELKTAGIHAVMSVVTLPNERSAALHDRFGFEKIACFREAGFKMNRRLDVACWELLLQ